MQTHKWAGAIKQASCQNVARATRLQEELSDIFGDKWRAELLDIFVQYEKRGVDSLKAVVRLHKTVKQFKTKT